jgi:maltose-binding protein MalE
MSWSDFTALASKLTSSGKYGLDWPLAQPTATVMNLALNYGGTFFKTAADGTTSIKVSDKELQVPEQIQSMIANKSLDPVSVTQNGSDALPAFFSGKDAMYVGGNYIAQQISTTAPAGFHWSVLPTLAGSVGAGQASDPQTLSVSAQSKYIKQSATFINYFMSASNQAKLAEGDWLIPASAPAKALVQKQTGGKNGWAVALQSGKSLVSAPFLSVADYPQWNDQVATPALQEYFAGKITSSQLSSQLVSGWKSISGN